MIGGRKKPGCPVEQVGQKVTVWILRDWDKYKNHTANELGNTRKICKDSYLSPNVINKYI